MITGFNHNIKYKEIVFHVQTEDSGTERAHIITHVFIGGNIITSVKNTYKNVVNAPQMRSLVKSMMQQQHKSVLKNLLSSNYDSEIDLMLNHISSNKEDTLTKNSKSEKLNIIDQDMNSPHLMEDKQKTILNQKKAEEESEDNLDDLILSFLEDNF